MAVAGDVDAVDEAEVIDVDRDFGVEDFLQRIDDAVIEIATRFARRDFAGLLRQETVEIVALARCL